MVRGLGGLFVRVFYRLDLYGRENIPERGPALLRCDHVSYIDFLLLCVAQPRTPSGSCSLPASTKVLLIRHLLRWGRAIPIEANLQPQSHSEIAQHRWRNINENGSGLHFRQSQVHQHRFTAAILIAASSRFWKHK